MSLCEERKNHLLESEHRSIVAAASLASCRAGSLKRDIGLSNTVGKDNRPRTSDSLPRSVRGTDREIQEVVHNRSRPNRTHIRHSYGRIQCKSVGSQISSDGGAEEDDLMVRPSSSSWSSVHSSSTFSDQEGGFGNVRHSSVIARIKTGGSQIPRNGGAEEDDFMVRPSSSSWSSVHSSSTFSDHEGGFRNVRHSSINARSRSVDGVEGSRPSRPLFSQPGTAVRRRSTSRDPRMTAPQYRADPASFLNDVDETAPPSCEESDTAPEPIARCARLLLIMTPLIAYADPAAV